MLSTTKVGGIEAVIDRGVAGLPLAIYRLCIADFVPVVVPTEENDVGSSAFFPVVFSYCNVRV